MVIQAVTRQELADLIEQHARLFAADLRAEPSPPRVATVADAAPRDSAAAPPLRAGGGALVENHLEVEGNGAGVTATGPGGRVEPWRKVGELEGQTYTWPGPDGTERYEPFEVWETSDARGRVQLGLARPTKRGIYYGRERGYWLAFEMVNGQKRRPIVVFNESDDHEQSGDLLGIIKGKGAGGRSMFAPGDELPAGYESLTVEVFRDRITGKQAFNRLAVVAEGGDRQAMLDHSLLQLRLRS